MMRSNNLRLEAKAKANIAFLQRHGLLEIADGWESSSHDKAMEARGGRYYFSKHNPIWAYCNPELAHPYDPRSSNKPVFEIYDNITSPHAITNTQYFVVLGVAKSDDFDALMELNTAIKLVFEPSITQFLKYIAELDVTRFLTHNVFFIVGDLTSLTKPLAELIDPAINKLGFPVFFIQEGLPKKHPTYVDTLIEYIEILYYRYRIYPLEGQENQRGLPLRNMKRELFFDQQKHFYENLFDYVTCGNLQQLKNMAAGGTAILVGAGPDLDNKINYLRRNMDKAVVICVNNALKTLLKHNLEPHFVVVNDTSVEVEKSFAGMPRLEKAILVAHCLSATGGEVFRRRFFFGNWKPELFGSRPRLRLHGSVITTAFSLARFLGCRCCVLVGVQLASESPWCFSYSQDSIHGYRNSHINDKLTNKFPQLYPVKAASGNIVYCDLNMRDVCLWLIDEVSKYDLEIINTTYNSIFYSPKVTIAENYQIKFNNTIDAKLNKIKTFPQYQLYDNIINYILYKHEFWQKLAKDVRQMVNNIDAVFNNDNIMHYFDHNNITYLLQRYYDFDYRYFSDQYYNNTVAGAKKAGMQYYLAYLNNMVAEFGGILSSQLTKFK